MTNCPTKGILVSTETRIQKICFLSWQVIQFKKTLYTAVLMTHREPGKWICHGSFKSLSSGGLWTVLSISHSYELYVMVWNTKEVMLVHWLNYTLQKLWDRILCHLDVVRISLWTHTDWLWSWKIWVLLLLVQINSACSKQNLRSECFVYDNHKYPHFLCLSAHFV